MLVKFQDTILLTTDFPLKLRLAHTSSVAVGVLVGGCVTVGVFVGGVVAVAVNVRVKVGVGVSVGAGVSVIVAVEPGGGVEAEVWVLVAVAPGGEVLPPEDDVAVNVAVEVSSASMVSVRPSTVPA